MNYRLANILADEAANSAATKTIDIEVAQPISSINIFFRGQNTAVVPTAHPAKMVEKIELVDGSDVLMSMSGMEAQALDFFHNSQPRMNKHLYNNDDWTRSVFNLNFGRYEYDPRFAFDRKRFLNPQLRIKHNCALGGQACDHGQLTVWAHCFDQKPVSPEGFLTAKEYYSYALGNNTYQYIDLPVDYPYRLMMIRSLRKWCAIWELFDEVKLSSDQDKHVIIDGATRQLIKLLDEKFGPYTETIQGKVGMGTTPFYLTPTSNSNCVVNALGGFRDYFQAYQPWGGYVEILAGAADTLFQAFMQGWAPHGALAIPFGDLRDPDDWFDVSAVGSLILRIHAIKDLATADTCDVVIQQLRRY